MIAKGPKRKFPKLRQAARDQVCVGCGADDGTTVLAHLPYRNSGVGMKCPDYIGAHLCVNCHAYADGDGRMDFQARYLWLTRTLNRLVADGLLTIGGSK